MRRHTGRHRIDPILAPDQYGVARPLQPEDLDTRVTRQGIYPSLPAPNGVSWSEYVRTHRNRPSSVSSSTEALESDQVRYVTRKIVKHARSMAARTRSLPTDSTIPYFQPIERGYMSEGSQEDVYATPCIEPSEHTINIGGTDYQSEITETDKVSTFTGLDDYDTLFAARHGRGALDPVPMIGNQTFTTTLGIPTPKAGPELINPMEQMMPTHGGVGPNKKKNIGPWITPPSSEIIGEGAAIFTDMTETILDALDKQVNTSTSCQHAKRSSPKEDQKEKIQKEKPQVPTQKEDYPDLFWPVRENYRISDQFRGYSDSLSADKNQMVLVELNNLSYRYGTSIYAVDRVNGTMYGKFSIGYRLIPEKATVIPQYQSTSMESEYTQAYENTLPGITSISTPIAKSTPATQASHIPVTRPSTERDIIQPISSEEARARYLERQMKGIDSVRLPSKIPSIEEESFTSMDLTRRINAFCKEQKEKRRKERETHKLVLSALVQKKSKQSVQPEKEEGEIVYSQLAHDMEKTRDVV